MRRGLAALALGLAGAWAQAAEEMRQAMEDCGVPAAVRALLDPALLRMADAFRNR